MNEANRHIFEIVMQQSQLYNLADRDSDGCPADQAQPLFPCTGELI
jgi:hypothetical protein